MVLWIVGHTIRPGGRHTFAEDHGITRSQLELIARIADSSVTSFKERKEASQKFYILLKNAREEKRQPPNEGQSGGGTERIG